MNHETRIAVDGMPPSTLLRDAGLSRQASDAVNLAVSNSAVMSGEKTGSPAASSPRRSSVAWPAAGKFLGAQSV